MIEQKLQSKIKSFLKKEGWIVIKTITLSENGYPDLICFRQGVTLFLEIKAQGETPKPLQEYRLRELKKQGFKAFWTDNYEDFKNRYND